MVRTRAQERAERGQQGHSNNQRRDQGNQRGGRNNKRGGHNNRRGNQGNQGDQGNQGYQSNQGYQGNQGYQDNKGYQGNQRYQDNQGNQGHQGNQRGNRGGQRGNQRGNRGNHRGNREHAGDEDDQNNRGNRSHVQAHPENHVIGAIPSKKRRETKEKTEPAAKEGMPDKVVRIEGREWASTKLSLTWVEGRLRDSRETTIIALNLMDFILDTENGFEWHADLASFKLSAACFFVAGLLTGVNNSAEAVAMAVNASVWQHVAVFYWEYENPEEALLSFKVTTRDVERGYSALQLQRQKFEGIVGGYKDVLDMLPLYLGNQISLPSPADQNGIFVRMRDDIIN